MPRDTKFLRSFAVRGAPLASALTGLIMAAGCATVSAQQLPSPVPISPAPVSPAIVPHAKPAPAARDHGSGLTADVFYRLLLGDVALQRGETSLAARAYFEAARDTREPSIARRATEVALAARMRGLAQESAKLWETLDPAAERPKQVLAALATGGGGKSSFDAAIEGDVKSRLEKVIADAALTERGNGEIFLQLNRLFGETQDRSQIFELVRELAKPYPNSPEAHFAVALAAYSGGVARNGSENVALEEIDRALELKPDWERAVLLKAELLARGNPEHAIAFLASFVDAHPDARASAGALAQYYIEQKRYTEARAVFQRAWNRDRSAREFEFGIAVISMQMKDWDTAESLFRDLKNANYGDNGAVELYLAQIADENGRYQEAIERYRAVPEGERAWLAKLRIAAMMGKLGNVAGARRYLADLPAVTIEQRIQVSQAEAQLLRDMNDFSGAYVVLVEALGAHPDSPELLYDTAMAAEKLDKIDDAESRLRRVIELKPDDAQALNALGYTLVDRTPRVAEGFALIERAYKLSPDDPFILDSMGWALFRLARYAEAENYLVRAMKERPDAEIAAHLGEILWAKGERERAKEIWQTQLKTSPDNPVLLETVRRLAR